MVKSCDKNQVPYVRYLSYSYSYLRYFSGDLRLNLKFWGRI